jgi:hypothetical protein
LCSVHDTVEFERRGIPATVFLTQTFRNAAIHTFKSKGMDGHPFIELPHPISNLTPQQMREVTKRFVGQFVQQVTD